MGSAGARLQWRPCFPAVSLLRTRAADYVRKRAAVAELRKFGEGLPSCPWRLPLADGALERWTVCEADSVVADHRIEPILTLEKPPKADRVAARGVRCGEHLARRSQTTPEKQRTDSMPYFASRSDPVMSRVVLRVPVVLRGKMDGQGGTERGTGWYRYRVIACRYHPVPPASTPSDEEFPFEYPLVPPVPPRERHLSSKIEKFSRAGGRWRL